MPKPTQDNNELLPGSYGEKVLDAYYRRERLKDFLLSFTIGACCAAAVIVLITYGESIDQYMEDLVKLLVR